MSVCCQTFFKSTVFFLQFLSDSHCPNTLHQVFHFCWKVCSLLINVIYMPLHKKTVEQIFKILILNFLANFWHFTLGLSLCSRQISLVLIVLFLQWLGNQPVKSLLCESLKVLCSILCPRSDTVIMDMLIALTYLLTWGICPWLWPEKISCWLQSNRDY